MSKSVIVINPYDRTVTDAKWDGTMEHLYKMMSVPEKHEVTIVEAITAVPEHTMYVDEEGLCKPGHACFCPAWTSGQPMAGVCVIENHGCTCNAALIEPYIVWSSARTTGRFEGAGQTTYNHPVFGKILAFTTGKPVFTY